MSSSSSESGGICTPTSSKPPSRPYSTFLNCGDIASARSLATLYLRRDLAVSVILQQKSEGGDGYDEGVVTNTRFGSFPHSTLTDVPWGTQVRASKVDTGSRGRKPKGTKRKREPEGADSPLKAAASASTGFAHLLPPTVESWCSSLPHRTQVVYTPDYSYILQRLRVRPGSVIIEAGAGSGSFTHAAARAVYGPNGKVFSFEFHEQRAQKLRAELRDHGLDRIVTVTHRDVYEDGFLVFEEAGGAGEDPEARGGEEDLDAGGGLDQEVEAGEDYPEAGGREADPPVPVDVRASSIFLDLPAPWLALKHLTRAGPLNSRQPIRICTFSPCIEQVQRTVQELREHGWLEIEMVEISAKRIEIRKDRPESQQENVKGVPPPATSVDEALDRLRELERRAEIFHSDSAKATEPMTTSNGRSKTSAKPVEGPLVHRPEAELKIHTSYLVFAVLPVELPDQGPERGES